MKSDFRMQAAIHQIDTSDWDDQEPVHDDGELPEALLAIEREREPGRNSDDLKDADGFGFGHIRV